MQYAFWLYNPAATPAWSELQASSAAATCPWTPTKAGNYYISLTAVDGIVGTEVSQSLWYTVTPSLALSVSSASPQPVSTPITFTATATGATNPQYQFWLYNPSATPAWSELQAFSTTAACTWETATAGNYLISVTARDSATGIEVSQLLWYTILPNITLTLSASPVSPQTVNTPITFTANATGATNPQYQFWLYNPAATPAWSELQAFSTTATCSWQTATVGSYLISVTVRDSVTGLEVSQMLWDTVIPNITLTLSGSPASPQPVNTPITFTAKATGATNPQYQFWLYNPAISPGWSELQAYSTPNICTWETATRATI